MSIATFDVSQDLPCSFLAAGRNFQKLPSLRSTRQACSLKKDRDVVWDRLVPHPSMHRSIIHVVHHYNYAQLLTKVICYGLRLQSN